MNNYNLNVHHIGYLVKKINEAAQQFQRLGYSMCRPVTYDDIRKINICFLEKNGYILELISPATDDSIVAGLMKRYKNSPYHICYETSDIDAALAQLTAQDYTAIDTPTPAPALDGRRVVFLTNPYLGMIELLET